MKVDITFDKENESAQVTFSIDQFISERRFNEARAIIQIFAGDFSLDPDLDADDFTEIINKAKEGEHESFTFEISEDGIEVDFPVKKD